MKLFFAFAVFLPSLVALDVPALFVPNDDSQDRELIRSKCEISSGLRDSLEGLADETDDSLLQELADEGTAFVDLVANMNLEEASVTNSGAFKLGDLEVLKSELSKDRRKAGTSIFKPLPERLEMLQNVGEEVEASLARLTRFLERVILGANEAALTILSALMDFTDFLSRVAFYILRFPISTVLNLLGQDGLFPDNFSYIFVLITITAPLALLIQATYLLVSTILRVAYALLPGGSSAGVECAFTRLAGSLIPSLKSLIRSHEALTEASH